MQSRLISLPRALLALAAAALVAAVAVDASAVQFGPNDVPSIFHIEKSENRNQVHYGVRLDANCLPVGSAPAFAYWRTLVYTPPGMSELTTLERRAYGIASQRLLGRRAQSGAVLITLRAMPDRAIMVRSHRGPQGCTADARATIGGTSSVLRVIYADIGTFGIRSVELRGERTADHRRVIERIEQ